MTEPVRWLSVAQVARRLHFSKDHVRTLIQSGVIYGVKTGPRPNSPYRVTEQAVDAYLARRSS